MKDFKKNNRFGGEKRGGFGGGFKGGRDSGRPTEMHHATCSECHKSCDVPFRPNGKKPVLCKECFSGNGGQSSGPTRSFDRFPKRDFAPATSFKPAYNQGGDNAMGDLKRQVETLNIKLDRLIKMMTPTVATPVVSETSVTETSEEKPVVKKRAVKKTK